MDNRFTRLAGAVLLAFATAAGTPAFAETAPNNPVHAQQADPAPAPDAAAPATPPATPYVAISPQILLLACTKDNHAMRMLVVAGAPADDPSVETAVIRDLLKSVQDATETALSQFNKNELDESAAPFETIQKAFNQSIKDFNDQHQTRLALVLRDFGITHKPDPVCVQPPAPAP